ncbi:MAG: hypothetical protein KGL46_03375 [Hyphomicrobiales bacterium]|nr:hypothetical protein [Hyphomicrobiales bacterium]
MISVRLALVLVFTAAPLAARADAAAEMKRFKDAFAHFTELRETAQAKGEMPTLADPDTARTLAVLGDATHSFGKGDFQASGQTIEGNLCGMPVATAMSYLFSGLDQTKLGPASDPATQVAVKKTQTENTKKYQNEMTPLIAFGIHCMALHAPFLQKFVSTLPPAQMTETRRAGLAKMRLGVTQMVTGATLAAADPNLSDANRGVLVAAIARDAPTLVPILKPEARAGLKASFEPALAKAPEALKPDMNAILGELGRQTCEGLCAY